MLRLLLVPLLLDRNTVDRLSRIAVKQRLVLNLALHARGAREQATSARFAEESTAYLRALRSDAERDRTLPCNSDTFC